MASMNPQLCKRLENVLAGEVDKAAALQVVAEGWQSVLADQSAFFRELTVVVTGESGIHSPDRAPAAHEKAKVVQALADARRGLHVVHQGFLRDLNVVIAAEAAIRSRGSESSTKSKPIETYHGVEIYSTVLGLDSFKAGSKEGLVRYKCDVSAVVLISCTREGIREMIDKRISSLKAFSRN